MNLLILMEIKDWKSYIIIFCSKLETKKNKISNLKNY